MPRGDDALFAETNTAPPLHLSAMTEAALRAVVDEAIAKGVFKAGTETRIDDALLEIRKALTNIEANAIFVSTELFGEAFRAHAENYAASLYDLETALARFEDLRASQTGRMRAGLADSSTAKALYGERPRRASHDMPETAALKAWLRDERERAEPIAAVDHRGAGRPYLARRFVDTVGSIWFELLGDGEPAARPTFSSPRSGARAETLFTRFVKASLSALDDAVPGLRLAEIDSVIEDYCKRAR